MDYTYPIHELRLQLHGLVYASWLENLFTPRWFLLAGLMVGMYAVWWLLVDKKRLRTLLLYGSLMAVSRVILDVVVALNLGRWVYSVTLLPIAPDIFVHDLTVTPLTYMLVYQYSPGWKQFWIANLIGSGLIFYGLLPLFSFLEIFRAFPGWGYLHSFVALFSAAAVMRAIMLKIGEVEERAIAESSRARKFSFLAQPAMKPEQDGDDGAS